MSESWPCVDIDFELYSNGRVYWKGCGVVIEDPDDSSVQISKRLKSHMSSERALYVTAKLLEDKRVECIEFEKIPASKLDIFASALHLIAHHGGCSALKKIVISETCLNTIGVFSSLAEMVRTNTQLESVHIRSSKSEITDIEFTVFMDALSENTTLRELDLWSSDLSEANSESLNRMLGVNKGLKSVLVNWSRSFSPIKVLLTNTWLRSMNICVRPGTNHRLGLAQLASVFNSVTCLEEIRLTIDVESEEDDIALDRVFMALTHNMSVRSLTLSIRTLDNREVDIPSIRHTLSENKTLCELRFAISPLSDRTSRDIFDALATHNHTLSSFSLLRRTSSPECVQSLCNTLLHNTTLTALSYTFSANTEEQIRSILEAMRMNGTLTHSSFTYFFPDSYTTYRDYLERNSHNASVRKTTLKERCENAIKTLSLPIDDIPLFIIPRSTGITRKRARPDSI
jgi:hypothetical protein